MVTGKRIIINGADFADINIIGVFPISATIENCVLLNLPETINSGETVTFTIVPDSGCSIKTINISGAQYEYNPTTMLVTLHSPTSAINISIVCEAVTAADNITLFAGTYTKSMNTHGYSTKYRATYIGNLHAGDVISQSATAKAGSDYQFQIAMLEGSSGETWVGQAADILNRASYSPDSFTMPVSCRVAITVKDNNNTSNKDFTNNDLQNMLQVAWADATADNQLVTDYLNYY